VLRHFSSQGDSATTEQLGALIEAQAETHRLLNEILDVLRAQRGTLNGKTSREDAGPRDTAHG
jgi:hypothetical protein